MQSRKTYRFSLKHYLGLMVLLLIPVLVQAQQDAQYTQYMYNTMSVNPGYAGSRGHFSVTALHRSQWVGLDGAPKTQTFNIHTPLGYRGLGMGVSLVNDVIGPTSETYVDLDLSYTLWTSKVGRLSFGFKASAHLLDVRFSELDEYSLDANIFEQDIQNRLSPNVGAGVYYRTENFYAGLSVPRILETKHFDESSLTSAKENMHLYFITGYVFELNPNLKFKPALLTKVVQGAPLQVDVSANFLISDKFILGAAYRWDAAVSGMVGFQVTEKWMLGLAYDREVTELGKAVFNDGSFEVLLRYDFLDTKKGHIKSPRFF